MTEELLHCFTNLENNFTVVAATLEEAQEKWDEWTVSERGQFDDDEEWRDFHNIFPISDNIVLPIRIEDELKHKPDGLIISDEIVWKATAFAWAQSQGRGVLCSDEW